MSCFGGRVSQDLYQNCCNANTLCEFNGDIDSLKSEPIYVQKVFDAVLFNLQGMKTVQNQSFTPKIPQGHRVKRVIDIRCKRSFNPYNVDDPCNLKLDVNTSISGATFLQNCKGEYLTVVGVDGNFSEKLLYAETDNCDDRCMGTPIFGTQNIAITGNVIIELDLLLCDSCNNDTVFTVCTNVNIAEEAQPLVLTNFFEICMPSALDTAFLPRFTEFCNSACEARLATNNCGRDLTVDNNGCVCGNLIIAICVTCEKKIIVPVQLCVLSTGYAQAPVQQNAICTTFPPLFPNQIKPEDTAENCVGPAGEHGSCTDCCDSRPSKDDCFEPECCNKHDDCCEPECCSKHDDCTCRPHRPQPKR